MFFFNKRKKDTAVFKDRWKPSSDWLYCGSYKYDPNDQCKYSYERRPSRVIKLIPSLVKEQIPFSSWVKEQIPLSIDHIYNKLPPKETKIIDWGYGEGVHFVSLHDSLYAITVNQGYDDTSGRVFIHSTSKSIQTD